ncbi:Coactosin [Leucoagaricus sp. SymC.cos]|nr:Coactosin [Leucoagaricus sp. SymC.cos]
MADVSDQVIVDAYKDVRDDKTETNWLLLDYESDRSDKLQLTSTGTGGLSELKDALVDSRASYAYVRVKYSNDKESVREKFILVVWIGPSCKVMRKAKISVHTADVKAVLNAFSIEVAARERDDLKEDPIVIRLRKAGGASYDGV